MALDTVTKTSMIAIEAAVKARVPVMLVGSPGTGKTATIRALADKIDYKLLTVIGSQCDPTDITGLPKGEKILEREDGTPIYGTVYLAPWWQVRIMVEKKVILFLDEFSNTSSSTRASMLTMLQNREFPNGELMPEETIVIGAMNAAEQAADGYELDLPTTNRIFFISWNPGTESWFDGMLEAWGETVSDKEMDWRHKIVGFVRDNPTWLHREPDDVETTEAYGVNVNDPNQMEVMRSAWASRRSWDNLAKVLSKAPDDVYIQDLIAQGLVGYAASGSFRDWLRRNSNISPLEVMKDPTKFDWSEMKLDDSNLILRALVEMVNDSNSGKIIRVFETIADADRADAGAPFIKDLLKKLVGQDLAPEVREENRIAARSLVEKYRNVSKPKR